MIKCSQAEIYKIGEDIIIVEFYIDKEKEEITYDLYINSFDNYYDTVNTHNEVLEKIKVWSKKNSLIY